ncbi:MAG: 16S rRNA (guanine(966)-N(2))-methyltransferase RsmD [Wenzhouxiangella sp.]|nr:MAG: 16S rRNA (guanine(966)-N(2))-methyltransferase RsmD [Wenzhouxiangella sp.]
MTGKIRIIAGRWRGRRLEVPDRPGLRPTGDRARETLFNWIGPRVIGARVLDLFAGTGALGLEAASRGAARVVLVERDAVAAGVLRKGALQWPGSESVEVIEADALRWLERQQQRFDLVLIDPPFDGALLEPALSMVVAPAGCLADRGLVYVECAPQQLPGHWPPPLEVFRQKQLGQVTLTLLQRSLDASGTPGD